MDVKRGRKRWVNALAVVLAAALIAGGSAAALAQDQTAAEKLVLRVGWLGEVDSLNPFVAWSVESYETFRLTYSLLTSWGPNLESVPDLAKSWESSDDGLTWTFRLVENAKWSDGQPVTSADVAFTFNYVIDNEMSMFLNYVSSIDSIDTPDPYTVVLHLSEPVAFMPQVFVWILPEHIWKDIPPETAGGDFANENPVGCGPFVLAENKPGEYIRFSANKEYFGGAPALDEVVFIQYANETTLAAALQVGDIDVAARMPEAQFQSLQNVAGLTALKSSGNAFTELAFNCWQDPASKGNPALLDPEFRRAVAQAIDKQKITDVVSFGLAEPGDALIPPVLGDFHWTPGQGDVLAFDLEAAKARLEAAGYTDTNGDGVREDKSGNPINLRFYLRSESAGDQKAGQMISEWLSDIGLQTQSEVMDDGTLSDHIYDNGDFDMFIWGWGGDVDPSFLLSVLTSAQIMDWSDSMYSNPEYDALFEQQQHLTDRQARVAMVHDMEKMLYQDCPYIILSYDPDLQIYRTDRFQGWVRTPSGGNVIMTFSPATYVNLKPVAQAAAGGGGKTGLYIGLGAVAVVLIAAVIFLTRRKPKAAA